MFDPSRPETFWLDFTNIALGLVTLVCVLAIAAGLLQELAFPSRRRAAATPRDDHAFVTPELGLTMADGGEPVATTDPQGPPARARR